MFNFYVVLAGHDIVTDTDRATACRCKFKAPRLQTKVQKMKDLPKTWVLTGKQFEDFRPKNQKFQSSHAEQNKETTRPQRQKLNMNHVARKK